MNLRRRFCNFKRAGNLFVRVTFSHQPEDFLLSGRKPAQIVDADGPVGHLRGSLGWKAHRRLGPL